MPAKKVKTCQICKTPFRARKDAKTCSAACRKRLQRGLKAQAIEKAKRLESAVGQEFHRLAAALLQNHVIHEPLVLVDERGGVPVSVLEAPPKMSEAKPEPDFSLVSEHPDPVIPDPGTAVKPLAVVPEPPTTPGMTDIPIAEPPKPPPEPVAESLEAVPQPTTGTSAVSDVSTIEQAAATQTSVAPAAMHLEDVMSTESLEPSAFGNAEAVEPVDNNKPPTDKTLRRERFMPFHYNKLAFLSTGLALLAVVLIGGSSLFLAARHNTQASKAAAPQPTDFAVTNLPLGDIKAGQQLLVGEANQVTINGQLQLNDTLVISPTAEPASPVTGQIYFDQTAKAPFYYDGTRFISLAPQQHVTSLGGASGVLGLGNGLSIVNNQLDVSDSVTQQINNAAGSGVLSLAGTANQVNVSSTTGNVTLSLPQSIAVTSTPTFGGLTVSNLGVGLVRGSASGLLSSGTVDRNDANYLSGTLSVANGGTGAGSFTANGILYGNGSGALQVTASAVNSVLVTSAGGVPSLSQTLPLAVQDNITHTGVLNSGSITAGFGTISTVNNISTTALIQAGTLQVDGGSFTVDNTGNFVAAGTGEIQGAGGLTLGIAGSTIGYLNLANATSTRQVVLQGLNPSGAGNATIQIPTIVGGSTDTVCLVTLGNCAGSGGGIIGSGTAGTIAMFDASNSITNSTLTQSGSTLTASGNVVIQGASALTLGTASTNYGAISFKNAANSNTLTLQAGITTGNLTLTLPVSDGTNGQCLKTNGTAALGFADCTGGAGGGVTSVNGLTGVISLANASGVGSTVTIDNAKADASTKGIATFNATNFSDNGFGTINTIQNIATTSTPTFAGLTLNGTSTSSALSIVQTGSNPAAGQALIFANNNTVTPTGNLLDLQNKGTSELHVDVSGNLTTIGNIQGVGITSTGTITVGTLGSTDTSAILCRNSSNIIAVCSGSGSGAPFVQGGNSFGTTATLGTNDNFGLNIRTNGTTAVSISNTGQIAVGPSAVPANGVLTVGTNTTAATGGLYFGTDTNLYRSGAGILNTDSNLTAAGALAVYGTASASGATGGAGSGVTGDHGGGGGGGIGSAATPANATCNGDNGAQALDVSGLFAVISGLGYATVAPGAGYGNCANPGGGTANGNPATGFGSGGGGANYWGGMGGNGLYGGGGGGASGESVANRVGGTGGQGVVVISPTGGTNVVETSSGTYTVPAGITSIKIWAIGAGGGGAGATSNQFSAGGGAGAGGVAYRTFAVIPGSVITYNLGIGGTGGTDASNGSDGTSTTVSLGLVANGGSGGQYNNSVTGAGGSFSGGSLGAVLVSGSLSASTAAFQSASNSTTAFQVQNAAGANIFNVDTTNSKIGTADTIAASTNSTALTIQSGNASGSSSNSGAVTIDSGTATGTAGNITIGNGSYAHNVTIGNGTGTSSVTILSGTGTSLDVGSNAVAHTITIGNSTGATSVVVNCGTGACKLGTNATAHTTTIGSVTTTSTTTIQAGTGGLNLGSDGVANTIQIGNTTGAVAQTINIGNNATASSTGTITIGNLLSTSATTIQGGTGASAVGIQAGTSGTISVGTTNVNTVTVGSTANTGTLTFGRSTAGETINIGNGNVASGNTNTINIGATATSTGKDVVTIGSLVAASTLTLRGGNTSSAVSIQSAASGTISLGTSGVANTIQIGNTTGAVAQTINIGNNATASSTNNVTIGSTIAGTTTLQNVSSIGLNAPSVDTNATTLALFNTTATTINVGGAVGAGGINLAGGSGSTGCTIDGSNGNLTCSGNITGSSTGTIGYWSRSGTTLQPATAGDAITTSGNISTSGSGTITSVGLLGGLAGLTVIGGPINLNTIFSSSVINIGNTSAGGAVAIQSASTIALTSGTTLGLTSTGANAINITPGGGSNTGVVVQPTADSTNAFRINLNDGTRLFTADTTNGRITIGNTVVAGNELYVQSNNDTVIRGKNTGSAALLQLANSTADVFSVANAGATTINTTTNSATAFQVQDASANVALVVSTNNYAGGANAANATLKVAMDSGTSRSINAAGTVNASGADYAEYIPWNGPEPDVGTVVTYQGSAYVVSSQQQAAFVGNDKFSGNSILVTFAGQVPVKVIGPVAVGDILVDNDDGTARAVNPAAASITDYFGKIGIAQEASSDSGVKLAKAAIGTTSSNVASSLQQPSSFTDINVSGTATINNLSVTGSATIGALHVTGSAEFAGNITVGGHIITASGQPTSVAQAAAGGSASVSVDGTDTTGTITITTGSVPSAGDLAKILFSKTYGQAPHIVLSPSNDKAAGLHFYKGSTSATDFMFNALDTPQANTAYTFDYFIAQ